MKDIFSARCMNDMSTVHDVLVRYIKEAKRGDVQLDENFHAYVQQSPLFLSEAAKNLLTCQRTRTLCFRIFDD